MVTTTKTRSLDDLLEEKQPFQLKVLTKIGESFLSKTPFGYFEWEYGQRQGTQLTTYSVAFHSDEPFEVEVDGKRVEISPRRMRLFVAPVFEREYRAGEPGAPEVVKEQMAVAKLASCWALEFVLTTARRYHAMVHVDTHLLPPERPGEKPRSVQTRVLWISDQPFKDGKAAGEMTPAYRGWTY